MLSSAFSSLISGGSAPNDASKLAASEACKGNEEEDFPSLCEDIPQVSFSVVFSLCEDVGFVVTRSGGPCGRWRIKPFLCQLYVEILLSSFFPYIVI